jgi:hypothetical protein
MLLMLCRKDAKFHRYDAFGFLDLRQAKNLNALGEEAMKIFTQLALVVAIGSCASTYALQTMDDVALADTTGRDGITILIASPRLTSVQQTTLGVTQSNGIIVGAGILHDKDGFVGSLGGGALILGDANQANTANAVGTEMGIFGSQPISVKIDTSNGQPGLGTGGTTPVLNVAVVLPRDLMIRTGDISVDGTRRANFAVGASGATIANAATGGTTGNATKIFNSMDINMGGASLNIQLGNTQQAGALAGQTTMIKLSGVLTNGLNISGLSLHDGNPLNVGLNQFGGGDLGVSVMSISDHNSPDLTVSAAIGVIADASGASTFSGFTPAGAGAIVITVGGAPVDIMMQNVTLGSTTSTLGDLQMVNLQAAGTKIAILGH